MGSGRTWSKEEKEYLIEKWGTVSIAGIAKVLNRSENAIIVKKNRLKLGAFLESGDYVSWNQLQVALGYCSTSCRYKMKSWVENRGFPMRMKRVKDNEFKIVRIDEFWAWAEQNQMFLDFSNFEYGTLGIEPDWVKEKRRADISSRRRFKTAAWTKTEDEKLITLVRKQQYGFRELSLMLQRSEGAIQRRLTVLGIKDRPVRADSYAMWTDEEHELLGKLIVAGKKYEQMAELIEKSVKAIRGRVYQMYLTENLDKVRQMIGSGPWGNGRPDRKIKHYLLMNQEEKQQTKELLTRLMLIMAKGE